MEIAKTAGFVISADELMKAQAEISEEELEGVTGGLRLIKPRYLNQGDIAPFPILREPLPPQGF